MDENKVKFCFVPVLYNEFIKIELDYVIIFNIFFDKKEIKELSIYERFLSLLLLNELLVVRFKEYSSNKYKYEFIQGDIYFPYFKDENLDDYNNVILNYINTTDFRVKINGYMREKDYNKYFVFSRKFEDLIENYYKFLVNIWNYDEYDKCIKDNSFSFRKDIIVEDYWRVNQ